MNEKSQPKLAIPKVPTTHSSISLKDRIDALTRQDRWWWRLGYETGHREGWLEGRDENQEAWNRIFGVWREVIARPTMDELRGRRAS